MSSLAVMAVVAGCSSSETDSDIVVQHDSNDEREALLALGYLEAHPIASQDQGRIGVEFRDAELVTSDHQLLTEKRRIRLIDMDGNVIREATADGLQATSFSEAEYMSDGTLLVVDTDASVLWLDRHWKPFRELRIPAHHDITSDGTRLYVVTRRLEHAEYGGQRLPLLVDYLTVVSEKGEIERELSIHEVAKQFLSEASIRAARRWEKRHGDFIAQGRAGLKSKTGGSAFADSSLDVYHTNYVHVAARDVPGVCRRGDLLVSIRNLDLIAFIRLEESRIVWSWGPGVLEGQHNPVLLADGNILLFDNGRRRKWSRVLEMDPRTGEIVWEYRGDPKESFFSRCCGSVEKLASGNVVITDTQKGHVFEITPDKRVVWDYWNSYKDPTRRERIAVMRSHRVAKELTDPPAKPGEVGG